MDIQLFKDILQMESTSGMEKELAEMLALRLKTPHNRVELSDVGDGTRNLLLTWGNPRVLLCTHLDTVPPYIPPTTEELPDGDIRFLGRGTCDAKGQIFSMWTACLELERMGLDGFGLLLLAGEETGSWGAKAFRTSYPGAPYVLVGEPTDNCMVQASKGTKAFEITIDGKAFHSGYPEQGVSAIDRFVDLMNELRQASFPLDPVLGPTTWNVGKLHSDNPQNILSPSLTCRIYFRTTFVSDEMVKDWLPARAKERDWLHVNAIGGDTPMEYITMDGIARKTVSFGSDAPQLTNCPGKMLCGPGSILVAHRAEEQILLSELQQAVKNYCKIVQDLLKS